MAGDFNDWNDQAEKLLARPLDLFECHRLQHGKLAKTFPSFWPVLSLDRIYGKGFNVNQCDTMRSYPWTTLSDHLPLMAEIEFHGSMD